MCVVMVDNAGEEVYNIRYRSNTYINIKNVSEGKFSLARNEIECFAIYIYYCAVITLYYCAVITLYYCAIITLYCCTVITLYYCAVIILLDNSKVYYNLIVKKLIADREVHDKQCAKERQKMKMKSW